MDHGHKQLIPTFKFVGQFGVMAESYGLYYMRARYYDPSVGRFISEDPIGFAGGDVNFYAYVSNDPVNKVDPLGLQAYPRSDPPKSPYYEFPSNPNNRAPGAGMPPPGTPTCGPVLVCRDVYDGCPTCSSECGCIWSTSSCNGYKRECIYHFICNEYDYGEF